ncbi:MAG: cell division protein FtsZ [Candidatus Komeilibacteria bacterium RIFCSPHIGHO2_01_FULL_52_14]|uniref:Cell division protein FtsZ n=1 Tax=Candidatus Komeilibacteria bacterium RIFCSPHIGHO2_01_FULL_52_14 TaxID=1798549 RepID=A0A1G2BM71_9BACT|nr:MAG: cell division protein FtsZ [Candidatus Komeilibacteria bacterium RIFCSPHIGHO2_01_FULL_52_14]
MARRTTFEVKPAIESIAKIKVVGVGGSGGAAINRMLARKIRSIEFIAMNTDLQALQQSLADVKLQIGKETTRGLGAGMNPDLGARSAEENADEIRKMIGDADMVFLTCGLGGGTGSGAVPVIADIAREAGALTVAVVTKPFKFEGAQRRRIAEDAYERLIDKVDTIITIPNDRLLQIVDKKTSLLEAFAVVDDVLNQGVIGISELITIPGMINVDFADVKAIMNGAGSALMGIGVASGEDRAVMAARAAVESPLLEVSIEGARGVLFVVTAGPSLTMHEVNAAAEVITASADPEAKIIFGTVIDERMGDELKATVIATGFRSFSEKGKEKRLQQEPRNEQFRQQATETPSVHRSVFFKPKESVPDTTSEPHDELDIPTFIRNQMKKR